MSDSINGPGDLHLWPVNLRTGRLIALNVANLRYELGNSTTSRSRVIRYVNEGWTDRQTPSQKQRYTTPFPTPAGMISACWKRFHQRFTTSFWIFLTECHDNIQTKTHRPKGALNAHSIGNKKLSYRWQTARCWFVKLLNVTDGQTDRRMNRQTAHDSINRACIASRGKNASQQCTHLSTTVSSYSNHNCKKSPFLRTPAFIFCLPWGRPCENHAKRCMNEKTIQCLPNPSQHVRIFIQ